MYHTRHPSPRSALVGPPHLLGLDLAVLHVHLVAAQHDGDVLAHPGSGSRRAGKTSAKLQHSRGGGHTPGADSCNAAGQPPRRRCAAHETPPCTRQSPRAAAPAEVPVPGGHVLVRQPGRDVKHDDGALAVDVVAVAQAAKLLLARGVPAVEADLAAVGGEVQGAHLHADGGWGRREGGGSEGRARRGRCAREQGARAVRANPEHI